MLSCNLDRIDAKRQVLIGNHEVGWEVLDGLCSSFLGIELSYFNTNTANVPVRFLFFQIFAKREVRS